MTSSSPPSGPEAPPGEPGSPEPGPTRSRPTWTVLAVVAVLAALVALAVIMYRAQPSSEDRPTAERRPRRERPEGRQCRRRACPDLTPLPTAGMAEPSVPTFPEPSPPPPSPTPADPELKPPLRGLLDREGPPAEAYVSAGMGGFVVQASWAELQPAAGQPLAPENLIDRSLAELRRLSAAFPGRDLGLKLRVYSGVDAPGWVKAMAGGPVPVAHPQSGETGTVPRFWTREVGAAYEELQRQLAARYDDVPEVREVVISRCTTFFAEPFLRNKGDRPSVESLVGAGFSKDADRACHREQIEAHQVWQKTRSDLALNPYQDIEQRGPDSVDEEFTEEMMRYCRASLGARCVLENNSLAVPPKYERMYQAMRAMGPPIAFQTATARKIGDLYEALELAVTYGASSVELPVAYRREPPASFAEIHARLRGSP